MKYTPITDPNTAPQFGQSGESVRLLQNKLNTQNAGKAGYTPLKEDGLYGPLTQAAVNPAKSSLIVTSGPAKMQGMKDTSELSRILSNTGTTNSSDSQDTEVGDTYTGLLDTISQGSDLATQRMIAEIKASKQNATNKLDSNYDSYKRGLQLLGIQHNEATFSPDLLAGHIQEAENEHQTKLGDLRREETKALMDANQAKLKGDLETFKTKMDYIRQIKKDQNDELKNYYDTISQTSKVAAIEAHDIYDTVNTLNDADKEEFLKAVSQKFKIPLGSLTQALNDEKTKRETSDLKTKNTESIINKRETVKTKTSGGGAPTSTQIKQKQIELDKLRGEDGYTDPFQYLKTYDAWKGTVSEFLSKFPVSGKTGYINPEFYEKLPAVLKPKTTSSSPGGFRP